MIRQHWAGLVVIIFAFWSFILALLALARLLLLSKSVELYSNAFGNQSIVWLIFILNICFGLAFGASAYGLWRRHNWGRLLFLWTMGVWSGFYLVILVFWARPTANSNSLTSNPFIASFRFGMGLLLSLWYLNLPHVKVLFRPDPSAKFMTED